MRTTPNWWSDILTLDYIITNFPELQSYDQREGFLLELLISYAEEKNITQSWFTQFLGWFYRKLKDQPTSVLIELSEFDDITTDDIDIYIVLIERMSPWINNRLTVAKESVRHSTNTTLHEGNWAMHSDDALE